jgi:hypothetical protein
VFVDVVDPPSHMIVTRLGLEIVFGTNGPSGSAFVDIASIQSSGMNVVATSATTIAVAIRPALPRHPRWLGDA